MNSDLLDTHVSPRHPAVTASVFLSRWPNIRGGGTFSPTTSTLIEGPSEVAVVDAQYLKDDVDDLGDMIEGTGKVLTTIYITHGHADHYFGIGPLIDRFPGVRCIATPDVIDYMKETRSFQADVWNGWFGDACVTPGPIPEPFEEPTFHVDGVPVDIIDIGQADISPTTVVHVPSIDTVIAGDAIYNRIHPMLGLSNPDEWQKWMGAIDMIERLNPTTIVAGHRHPDADDTAVAEMIGQTRAYLEQYRTVAQSAETAQEIVVEMTRRFPTHDNLWTLEFSAGSTIRAAHKALSENLAKEH